MKKRKFVFGMGAGCCGTSSLAWLLNNQEGAFVGHELFPILPWSTSEEARTFFSQNKWEQLNHESHLYDIVGDVATYYLPYARFLIHNMESTSLKEECEFRFIILKRNKEQVIEAFIEKFRRQNNNPLQNSKASGVRSDNWDASFPKYDNMPLLDAVTCYYEDYYTEAEWLVENYPKYVRIYKTEDLNNFEMVANILEFVEIENPRVTISVQKNKREDASVFE